MSREIYVPIADAFFESSIMREELPVRFVMLALIRLGLRPGARGVIDMDPVIFAQSINIPYPDVERAIQRLMEPDPASGCPDEDGRRIVPTNPARPFRGWRLVNWGRYKDIVHRANDAARKRDERSHEEDDNTDDTDTSTPVRKRPTVSENGATKTKTNTKTNTKEERTEVRRVRRTVALQDFEEFWKNYPRFRKSGKQKALEAWEKVPVEDRATIIESVKRFASMWNLASPERFCFCPLPTTYLNQRRDGDDDSAVMRMVAGDEPGAMQKLTRQMSDAVTNDLIKNVKAAMAQEDSDES